MHATFRWSRICLLALLLTLWHCRQEYNEPVDESVRLDSSFSAPQDMGLVEFDDIQEASGLAASRRYPGLLWTHNDSGDDSRLFLMDESGKHIGSLKLKGVEARDWEDIALGPGPEAGVSYIYVGEIGDNEAKHKVKTIYRFKEPKLPEERPFKMSLEKKKLDKIRFKFPDGRRDAETVMVDPQSRDIYILSKREDSVRIYRTAYPQNTKKVFELEKLGKLHFTKAISGDISPDGREILIKNYANVYYWQRSPQESVAEALQRRPVRLPYVTEPQGESIAWKLDASGYFTISEERNQVPARLYGYLRQP